MTDRVTEWTYKQLCRNPWTWLGRPEFFQVLIKVQVWSSCGTWKARAICARGGWGRWWRPVAAARSWIQSPSPPPIPWPLIDRSSAWILLPKDDNPLRKLLPMCHERCICDILAPMDSLLLQVRSARLSWLKLQANCHRGEHEDYRSRSTSHVLINLQENFTLHPATSCFLRISTPMLVWYRGESMVSIINNKNGIDQQTYLWVSKF